MQVNKHKALPIVVWGQVVSSSEGDVMLFVFLAVSDCKRRLRNLRDTRSWVRKEEKHLRQLERPALLVASSFLAVRLM